MNAFENWVDVLEPRRMLSAGEIDASFGTDGAVTQNLGGSIDTVHVGIEPDQKIIVTMPQASGTGTNLLMERFTGSGQLDPSFGKSGKVVLPITPRADDPPSKPVFDSKGHILVAAGGELFRFHSNGKLDASFGVGGIVKNTGARELLLLPDDRIVATFNDGVERLMPNGLFDSSFGKHGRTAFNYTVEVGGGVIDPLFPFSPKLRPNGDILVCVIGGDFDGNELEGGIVRVKPDGQVDRSIGDNGLGGKTDADIVDAATVPNGNVFILNDTESGGAFVREMRPNGSYVKSYGENGALQIVGLGSSSGDSITTTADGKLLIPATDFGLVVARLTADGTFDRTYRGGGESFLPDADDELDEVSTALAANGDLVLARAGAFIFDPTLPHDSVELQRISGSPEVSRDLSVTDDGVLTVHGTTGNDAISVSEDQVMENTDGYLVTVNGKTTPFSLDLVKSIVIDAGAGNDSISIAAEPVSVNAGAGNDTISISDGDHDITLSGGAGNDTVDLSNVTSNLNISLDNKPNDGPAGAHMNVEADIENIIGGSGDDLIIGGPLANHLYGGPGNDTLWGGGGNDTLEGGHGHDQLFGQGGDDLFIARDNARDTLDGGDGFDWASADAVDFVTNVESILP